MRILVAVLFVLLLALPSAALASESPAAGSLSIEDGAGVVTLKGHGGVLGKFDGVLQIVDLTPNDRWRPIVNGKVVKKPRVRLRGEGISFRVLGGKFRIVLKGRDISVSARGYGWVALKGDPDTFGYAGLYSTDADVDCIGLPDACEDVPRSVTKITFGMPVERGKGKDSGGPAAKSEKPERGES